MLSMVEVKCPHCQVRGQIMLPPLGAIIVGPCPNCDGLVLVFSGKVLPLSKEIIVEGDLGQKAAHLRAVVMDYLTDKINRVAEQLDDQVTEGLHDYTPEHDDYQPPEPQVPKNPQPRLGKYPTGEDSITDGEVDKFVRFDLPRIDWKDYFHEIFDE